MGESITLTAAGKKFWGTKKATLRVVVTDKPVRTYGGYWSGGSISYWRVQTKNGTANPVPCKTNPFDGGADPEYTPSQDIAVVQSGVFNGKPGLVTVYVTSKEGWPW
jgi:hypothetical protein